MSKDNKGSIRIILIIAAILLFGASVYFRQKTAQLFITPYTGPASGHILFFDYPPTAEWAILKDVQSILIKEFSSEYILSMVLLLGSIFLGAAGLAGFSRDGLKGIIGKICSMAKEKPVRAAAIIFIIALALLIPLQRLTIGDRFGAIDEFAYYFQTNLLMSGKLYADSPQPMDAFHTMCIINNGKWFAKYTIGWPLLMVPGMLFHIPWLINPILGALAIAAAFLAGREIYDEGTGILAALILLFTPMFVLNSLSLFPHTSHILFLMIFTALFFRTIKKSGTSIHAFFAGTALGMMLLIRPAESVFVAFSFFIYGLLQFFDKNQDKKQLFSKYLVMICGFAIPAGFLLYANKAQTGSPTTLAFSMYDTEEKWGFGNYGHNSGRGFWNFLTNSTRLFIWLVVFTIELAIISLFEKRKENFFLFSIIILVTGFYYFYYSLGNVEYGPRYFFIFMGLLIFMAVRGLFLADNWFKNRFKALQNAPLIETGILLTIIFMVVSVFPPVFREAISYTHSNALNALRQIINRDTSPDKKLLVFLRSDPDRSAFEFTHNLPGFRDRIVYAIFLDPETNEKVRAKFSDRECYIMDFDFTNSKFFVRPYYDKPFEQREKQVQIDDLLCAAFNYAQSVKNMDKTIELLDKALALSPGNPELALRKAAILMDHKRFKDAIPILEEAARQPGVDTPIYALALSYARSGEKEKGIETFRKFLTVADPNSQFARRAKFWIEYLQTQN
ncbi:MAG: glycosyltransferase family 39 protein [Firmicutes bacterium]|nr:glycosyltransferase family 39 protein [Bacillota bacterium]